MKHLYNDVDKNKYEAYDKAEVLALIQEMAESGELPEEVNGLVITLKNYIDNQAYKIAFCTQAKYNELEAAGSLETNCYYFITDDTSYDDIISTLNNLNGGLNEATDDIDDINEDITTINQRLDDLGFEEGSFTFTNASSTTASTNSIKKQGKRCIANLGVTFTATSSTIYISVPSAFKPKSNTGIVILTTSGIYTYTLLNQTYSINTSGDIQVSGLTNGNTYFIMILNAGWEIN